jgi:polysaccharide biosynthesis/export protein
MSFETSLRWISAMSLCLVLAAVGEVRADDISQASKSNADGQDSSYQPDNTAKGANLSGDYVLQPLDLVKVEVFQQPDLEREVRLTRQSTVNLPLVGNVDLKGKTVNEAAELIRTLYDKDYLVNPQITLTVLDYNHRKVDVLGSVNSPGTVSFRPEQKMGLIEAITRAGGFTRLADRSRVKLTRTMPDGSTQNFIIDADDLIQGKSSDPWYLQQEDIIFVPERIL